MMSMTSNPTPSHCASIVCEVPAHHAFVFLSDGLRLGLWALGSWQPEPVGDGVVRGRSLFDDQPTWVRPVAGPARWTIAYHVGAAPDQLRPRIRAVVEPGETIGLGANCCRVSLDAERDPSMDDARWQRLVRCHEVEILLIQARLLLEAAK